MDKLDQTSWFTASESLLHELGPIAYTSVQISNVNVVKVVVWPGPFHLAVVNLKDAIGGNEFWLYGTEVCTKDLSIWMLITHLDSPDTGSSTNVKDLFGHGNRRKMK